MTKKKKTKVITKKISVKFKKKTVVKTTKTPSKKPVKLKIDMVVVEKPKIKNKSDINIVVPRNNDVQEIINDPSIKTNIDESVIDDDNKVRRRRGRNKKEKIYFSKKTEEAITEYNAEECNKKRNEIYESRIKYSFEKLVENIFNTFKFTYFDTSPIEIQRETVSHLVSNMHKFQSGKGKAFSYFSIIAKNYLIFHNNNNYKRYNQHVDISETPSEESVCLQTEDVHHKDVQNKEFMNLLIRFWEKNANKIFTKTKDLNIANAVIELFRSCDRIENFNKKTLYLYIREISNCKTQQITKVLNKMKNYQTSLSSNYIEDGSI